MSPTTLAGLAEMAGIEEGWWDFYGTFRSVGDETKRAFLAAMGFAVTDAAEAAATLAAFEERPWRRWLEPVVVAREGQGALAVTLTLPDGRDDAMLSWSLDEELGVTHAGQVRPADLPLLEERQVGKKVFRRWRFELPGLPPIGYHRLRLVAPDTAEAETTVIVAPARGFIQPELEQGAGLWGIATQVYALRRDGDWGVGDYTAVRDLANRAATLGAAAIGVNPLHALFPTRPEQFSPYSPSSRLFANITYLDLDQIPEFAECEAARRKAAEQDLAALRRLDLVDYSAVGSRKLVVLRLLYRWFRDQHLVDGGDDRGAAFRRFQRSTGAEGQRFATFEALYQHFGREDHGLSYWRHWPEPYRHPGSKATAEFAIAHREEVEFFWWLQFLADEQLAAVAAECRASGMAIGLYRDVGVGIADDGGDSWLLQDCMAQDVTVGAPPDPLSPNGQDWGLRSFNPVALREAAYAPFIAMLRSNMRHAGALRLDHAMQLQRLYWVPQGAKPDQGAYVRFPAEDLFAIVALESRRNRCLVIGEDLGTVPEGFRERMHDNGVFGYRLLVFERDRAGDFKPCDEYPAEALAAVATHDLPSLLGYWRGIDVDARTRLELYPRPGMGEEEARARAQDRTRWAVALYRQDLLPDDFPTHKELTREQVDQLILATHAFLERAPSRLLMVQLEDLLGLIMQMNLPGTTDQHPNWRRRYPLAIAEMMRHPRLRAVAEMLTRRRGGRTERG